MNYKISNEWSIRGARTKLSGKLLKVARNASSVETVLSVNENALERISKVGGTWWFRLRSIHWANSSRKRPGEVPVVRIPRAAHALWSSWIVRLDIPSLWITRSSALICLIRFLIWNRRKLSVPNALIFIYLQIETSCGRDKLSSVNSSSNCLATLRRSSVDGCSPVIRICRYIVFVSSSVFCLLDCSHCQPFGKNWRSLGLPLGWKSQGNLTLQLSPARTWPSPV